MKFYLPQIQQHTSTRTTPNIEAHHKPCRNAPQNTTQQNPNHKQKPKQPHKNKPTLSPLTKKFFHTHTNRPYNKERTCLPEFEQELIAVCGVYCGSCPVFSVKCPGCSRDPRSKECALFSCAAQRGVRRCFQCGEFPCPTHYEKGIYTKQALDSWKRMMGR